MSSPLNPTAQQKKRSFLSGVKDTSPVLIAALPFALIVGITATNVGLTRLESVLMSVVVFAGAAQLVGLQLIAQESPIFIILIVTFFINLRFLMYSLTLVDHFKKENRSWRSAISFLITDQSFAFAINRFTNSGVASKPYYYLGLSLPMWFVWMTGTILGVFLGTALPESWSLDFAVPLMFLALLIPNVKDKASLVAALVGGSVAVAAKPLPLNLGLILAALVGVAAALIVESKLSKESFSE